MVLDRIAADASHEELFARHEVAASVQSAIGTLPAKLRAAILLRYFEDLSYADMATALNCSIGTVASRLSRGHRLLAKKLATDAFGAVRVVARFRRSSYPAKADRQMKMLNRHVVKSLTRYCDGELSAAETQRVDAHLASCAQCRATLDDIQFSARLVRQLSAVTAPPSVWNGIDAALSEPQRQAFLVSSRCAGRSPASLMLAVAGSAYWWTRETAPQPWEVAHTMGGPRRMAAGEWVETKDGSKARIIVGTLGTVDVAPGTRVQLGEVRDSEYRLALARGTISAEINAPPRLFIVDTPASAVVDLGCAYTVTVGDDGAGELRMTSGWAALEYKGRESLVPAGAICRTFPGIGPGTPLLRGRVSLVQALRPSLRHRQFSRGGVRCRDSRSAPPRYPDPLAPAIAGRCVGPRPGL